MILCICRNITNDEALLMEDFISGMECGKCKEEYENLKDNKQKEQAMNKFTEDEIMTYIADWCDDNNLSLQSSADLWEIFKLTGIDGYISGKTK